MECIKKIYLLGFILTSIICFAKTESDTITNWQIYKGSQLLFASNYFDCYKPTGIIKQTDKFDELRIVFFRDTKSYGVQKIKLFNDNDLEIQFDFKDLEELKIPEKAINKLFKNSEVHLRIIYFDKIDSKGILLGHLLLEN